MLPIGINDQLKPQNKLQNLGFCAYYNQFELAISMIARWNVKLMPIFGAFFSFCQFGEPLLASFSCKIFCTMKGNEQNIKKS